MKKIMPAADACPQCGGPMPAGTSWCPRCVGESFFETDAFTMPRAETDLKEVGRYRVVELIGEGGFGRVYRALETGPLEREVALKVIKPGLDSRPIIERFNAERQALVLLDHPNIARVLDAGETEDGRPFFAMELVEGLPLNEFCRAEHPDLETRLRLFLQICAAVEHAHAKGIIHRDLKPGNILVTWSGKIEDANATVIDFGIAKALFSETAPHTGTLGAHLVLGTPEYMSPEQAASGGGTVDTRSDVFSLGALLFEMITGAPPLDAEQLRRAPLEEVLRLIRECEPRRASTRMQPATVDPLTRRVADELDWVVLKALAKERERRYQTARELGEDVRRFLDNDTVSARPPSLAYLGQKLIRRHRTVAAAVAVAVMSLALVALVSVITAQREIRAQEAARRHFSEADTVLAHDRAREMRHAEAVALLCRALRTEPQNDAARMRLLTLLARPACGVTDAPALEEDDLIDTAEFLPPDGRRVLARISLGHSLALWETGGGQSRRVRAFRASSTIISHAVAPTAGRVAAGTTGSICHVWDLESGAPICGPLTVTDAAGAVRGCVFSPDGTRLFAGAHTPQVRAFDLASGEVLWTHTGAPLTRLVMSPDGRTLAVGCEDGALLLLDPETGAVRVQVKVQTRPLGWLHFTPDGRRLLAGGGQQEARFVEVASGRLLPDKISHWTAVRALSLHASGQVSVHTSDDMSVRLCDSAGRALSSRPMGMPVSRLLFAPDAEQVSVVAGTSGPLSAVSVMAGQYLNMKDAPVQFESAVRDIDFHQEAQRMVVTTHARQVEVLDVRPRRLETLAVSAGQRVLTAFFSRDGGSIVALCEDGLLLRWDRRTLKRADNPAAPLRILCDPSARFCQSGDRLAVLMMGADSRHLTVVDVNRWQKVLDMDCAPSAFLVKLSPSADVAALAERDGGMSIYDVEQGRKLESWKCEHGYARALAVSDGARFVMTSHLRTLPGSDSTCQLTLRDHTSGLTHHGVPGDGALVLDIDIAPDGRHAVTGGSGRRLDLWDLETGTRIESPLAHTSPGRGTTSGIFSPDSRLVLTGNSFDRRLRIWNSADGAVLGAPLTLGQDVRDWKVSADGKFAITADSLQTVAFWHLGWRLPTAGDVPDHRYLVNVDVTADAAMALAARSSGEISLWLLPPVSAAPLPEVFLRFAEGFGRWRVGDDNVFGNVPYAEFDAARRAVLALPDRPSDRQLAWMKWLASDPDERPSRPE